MVSRKSILLFRLVSCVPKSLKDAHIQMNFLYAKPVTTELSFRWKTFKEKRRIRSHNKKMNVLLQIQKKDLRDQIIVQG